ncbi:MAG TPA: hypothetical protein VHA78_04135 [Candidatus Peribacteraceae bacterium]|nr:hypothetical protein [Candidatus Peribacteraceae bacterium]
MRKLKKSEYVLAGILALVAAFPLAVHQPELADVSLSATVATTQQQEALNHYSDYRQNLRDYQKATQICIQLRAEGKDITCPDVNDYDAIQRFLNGDYAVVSQEASSSSSSTPVLQQSDLNVSEQNLLRWYQRINFCPVSLQNSMPAFYNLCESTLNPFAPTIRGWRNPNQAVAGTSATLEQIIDANKGAARMW